MSVPLFLLLAVLTVASALVIVIHRNPIYSALGLVSTLFLLALLFVGLEAHMVAVLQIIVYAGAIVVLFLFVIMLLNLQVEEREMVSRPLIGAAVVGGLAAAASALWVRRNVDRLDLIGVLKTRE